VDLHSSDVEVGSTALTYYNMPTLLVFDIILETQGSRIVFHVSFVSKGINFYLLQNLHQQKLQSILDSGKNWSPEITVEYLSHILDVFS
ncbi:hypothetical protein H5410_008384, partial [Solanum commersonii]